MQYRRLGSSGLKVSVIRERTEVSRAGPILRDNHYGWFDRVKTGHYDLSPKGQGDLIRWSGALEDLAPRSVVDPRRGGAPES